jgi:hypothetical protein
MRKVYPTYTPSQFNRKDYRILYNIASSESGLRHRISNDNFRDKRFQRSLNTQEEWNAFTCPYNKLATLINTKDPGAKDIVKWRLNIKK